MKVSIIGGTYLEIDHDYLSYELFGSGLRGAKFFLENSVKVDFYTRCNEETKNFLKQYQKVYTDFNVRCLETPDLITFTYNFSLDSPTIFPNPKKITKRELEVEAENILAYGMLELDFSIVGKKVVYDPQTSINPKSFSQFGKADELVYIVNLGEAQSLSQSRDIELIKSYFFNVENAKAFIIKNGPYGATLYLKNIEIYIPSYITNSVNKIGSGDIFTASFTYYWLVKDFSFEEAALFASRSTACYCDNKVYQDCSIHSEFQYPEYKATDLSKKQVYLASPFFSLAELIFVDKIRTTFISFGVKVFSPYHDIGIGNDTTIAIRDFDGIDSSDIVFCMLDNNDSGTMVEAGFSIAKGKKIIGYHRTCNDEKLLMLKSGDFKVFNHLTTAVYHTIWSL